MNTVKKIFLLFLLCVTCATSCKKDQDELGGSIIVMGTMKTISTMANSDSSVSNLDAEARRAFGEDYRLSKSSLRVTIKGSINEADFEPLKYFAEVNLEEALISGKMKINQEVLSNGGFRETYEENAVPMNAFAGSTKLQKITFADGSNEDFPAVKFIGLQAFQNASKLEVVANIKSVEYIGTSAFAGCSRYGVDVEFKPGVALKKIDTYAFDGCELLCGVDLAEAAAGLSIGDYAFKGCDAMRSLVLPDNLAAIGMYSFVDCESLTSIKANMGYGVITKGDDLETIKVPELSLDALPATFKVNAKSPKVVYIESEAIDAYSASSGWTEYNLQSPEKEGWKIVYNEANAEDASLNTLDAKLKSVFGVTYAQNDNYKVKVVGTMNEADFKSLRYGFSDVDLSGVDVVGAITIGSSYSRSIVTRATTPATAAGDAIPADIFANSKYNIKSFKVPASISVVGEAAFEGNETINDLDLSTDGALKLCTAAFRSTGLGGSDSFFSAGDGAIEIAANVTEIEDYVFDDCADLRTITFKGTTSNIKITSSSFPEKFKSDADYKVVVPASASGIYNTATLYNEESDAYEPSYWREYQRYLDDEASSPISSYAVTGFGDSQDYTHGTLQSSLIEVFGQSYNTQTKIILSGTINHADFEFLRTFEDIDMQNVTMVGDIYTNVSNSEGVKATYTQAFPYNAFCGGVAGLPTANGNTVLKRIVLPSSLQELGVYALANCTVLKTVIFTGSDFSKFNSYAFYNTAIEEFPGTEEADASKYAEATGLVNFPRSMSAHASSLFYKCASLRSADLTSFGTLTTLESSFFRDCSNLASVKLPTQADFTYIQSMAFMGCVSLPTITIPNNVLYLGLRSFENCTSLTSIDIPSSITGNTTALKDLSGNFNGCNSLVKITVNWADVAADTESGTAAVSFVAPTIYKETKDVDGVTKYMTFPEAFLKGGSRYITVAEGTLNKYIDADGSSSDAAPGWANYNLAEAGENKLTLSAGNVATEFASYFASNGVPAELILDGTIAGGADDNTESTDFAALLAALEGAQELTSLDMSNLVITGENPTALPYKAFSSESANLKIVTLPASVTTIGYQAFANSSIEIVFADAVTKVAEEAFAGAESLVAISLPNLESIEFGAFKGTTSLSNFVLPSSLRSLGAEAFMGSGLTSVNIPSSIIVIEDDTFNGCSKMSSVVLPSSLTMVQARAFDNCALTTLTIPATVTKIGAKAFARNRPLASITFETATEGGIGMEIGEKAFAACDKISSVTLPAHANFGSNPSADIFGSDSDDEYSVCDILTNITIRYTKDNLPAIGANTLPLRFAQGNTIGQITLPAGSKAADYTNGWEAYNLSEASEFTVNTTEGGLKEAILTKWRDFYSNPRSTIVVTGSINTTDLEALQMVVDGKSYAFSDIDLSGVTISGSQIPESTFTKNETISRFILPQTVSFIGNYAFNGCTNLLEFEFPAALSTIGAYAFVGTKLSSVKGLANLESLGIYAFRNCTLLKSVDLSEATKLVLTESNTNIFNGCKNLTTVKLPETLTMLPEAMFYDCSSLKNITIPSSVEWIDARVFYQCASLESINIPSSVNHFEPNNTNIYQTFYGCSALDKIMVNWESVDAIPEIDGSVFPERYWVSRAENSISIPNSGITAADYQSVAGWSTYNLAVGGENEIAVTPTIDLSSALVAKWGSSWRESAALVDADYALKISGSALKSDFDKWYTTLGATIKSLDISDLSIVDAEGNMVSEISNSWWAKSITSTTVSPLTKIILSDEITKIGSSAFYSATKLSSVTMDGVSEIGSNAFAYCTSLIEVELQDAILKIGDGAYKYSGLISFATPERAVTAAESTHISIGASAFESCAALTNVSLGHGVKSIGVDAFKGCSTLGLISLPSTVTALDAAFEECSQLINIEVAWSKKPSTCEISDSTFPASFKVGEGGNILLPVGSETADFDDSWQGYNLVAQQSYTVVNTAGNLATNMALKGAKISDKVQVIGNMNSEDFAAFANYNLTEIDLSGVVVTGTVTYSSTQPTVYGNAIPMSAFASLTSLKSVKLPLSISKLGDSAFLGCKSLESVNRTLRNAEYIGESAFDGCASLVVDFEDDFAGVTTISARAFAGVQFEAAGEANKLVLTDIVKTLGDGAFAECSMTAISVPLELANRATSTVAVSTFPTSFSIYGANEITIVYNDVPLSDMASLEALCGTPEKPGYWYNFRVTNYEANRYSRPAGAFIVENSGDADDSTNNRLTAAIRAVAGYESFDPKNKDMVYENIYVLGSMNNADFESLRVFKSVDLSGVSIVGDIMIQPAMYAKNVYTSPIYQAGAAIPTLAFANVKSEYSNLLTTDKDKCVKDFTNNIYYEDNTILEKITFPVSITTIGSGAFTYCKGLKEINFIEGTPLTTLNSSVFAYTNISEVKLPAAVTTINWACFAFNDSLTKADFSAISATTMIKFDGGLFNSCDKLVNFQAPENLDAAIGQSVFQSCISLESFHSDPERRDEGVYFPSTKGVGMTSFKNCTSLKRVEFPASVNGASATNSKFPSTTFAGCSALEEIICPWTSSVPELTYSTKANSSTIPDQFLKSTGTKFITIPSSAIALYTGDWEKYNLRAEGLDQIELDGTATLAELLAGSYSFWANGKAESEYGLTKLYISGEMSEADYAALASVDAEELDLSGVTSTTVYPCGANKTVLNITLSDATTTIKTKAFELWSVTLTAMPESLETLEANAFANVKFENNEVTLPSSLKSIGNKAFYLTEVSKVYLPWTDVDGAFAASDVPTIGVNVFSESLGAEGLVAPYDTDVATMYASWTEAGYTVITEAGEELVYSVNVATAGTASELLKDSKPEVEGYSVVLKLTGNLNADDIAYLATADGVGYSYIDLSGATIENNAIAPDAFKGNATLKTLLLPSSVSEIGASAFEGASKFATLKWSAGAVATVGDAAFKGTALGESSVQTVLYNVAVVPASCFEGNAKYIGSLTLPQAVISIGSAAFKGCAGIAEIIVPNSTPAAVATDSFEGMTEVKFTVYQGVSASYFTVWGSSMIDPGTPVTDMFEVTGTAPVVDPLSVILTIELSYTDDEIAAWGSGSAISAIPTTGKAEAAIIAAAKAAGVADADNYMTNGTIFKKLIVTGTPNAWDYLSIGNKFKSVDMSGVTKTVGNYQTKATASTAASQVPWVAFSSVFTVTDGVVTKIVGSKDTPETVMEEFILPSSLLMYPNSPFAYMTALKKVVIPAALTKTSWNVFAYCTSLESVEFEDGSACTVVAAGSFRGCTSLKSIVIPDSVVEFSVTMFNDCPALESVNIPSGVTKTMTATATDATNGAFYNCSGLKTINVGWSAAQAKATDMVDGYLPAAFYAAGNDGEHIVYVPDAVEAYSSTPLAKYNLVSTGEGSGDSGDGDDDVSYEVKNTTAGELAAAIAAANIPAAATDEIIITGEINATDFKTLFDGAYAKIDMSNVTVVEETIDGTIYAANTVPEDAFGDGNSATYNGNLISIKLPKSVHSIGMSAFWMCNKLTTVEWDYEGEVVPTLNTASFKTCNVMSEESVEAILNTGITTITGQAFRTNTTITKLVIPASVTSILGNAFNGCSKLVSIYMPKLGADGVMSITNTALPVTPFTLYVPESDFDAYDAAIKDTTLGTWSSYSKMSVETYDPADLVPFEAATCELSIKGLEVTSVGSASAGGTGNMVSLIQAVSDDVKTAWDNGEIFGKITVSGVLSAGDLELLRTRFYSVDMSGITFGGFHINTSTKGYDDYTSKGTTFPFSGLEYSETIEELVFPTTLTAFSNRGCQGIVNLKSITIPDGVGTLSYYLFKGCSKLESVTFSEGKKLTKLGGGVFSNCTSLKTITLPETIDTFSNSEFLGCSALESINIPAKVATFTTDTKNEVLKYASTNFKNCPKLKAIYTGWVSKATYVAASETDKAAMYVVPANLKDANSCVLPEAFLGDGAGEYVIYAPEEKSAYSSAADSDSCDEFTFAKYNIVKK